MNYLGIKSEDLALTASCLNKLLASYNVYYQNLRSFHWHVRGRSFFDLHGLFEEFYNNAQEQIDDIAERILTIGHKPDGSLHDYLSKTKINESRDLLRDDEMVRHTLYNLGELIKIMRETLKEASRVEDEGTVDLISNLLGKKEKELWLLSSWQKRIINLENNN